MFIPCRIIKSLLGLPSGLRMRILSSYTYSYLVIKSVVTLDKYGFIAHNINV